MSTPDLTSGEVMNSSAALLNDAAKSQYSYTAQLPYLNLALQSLQEEFELNEVPVVDTFSAVITMPAGTESVGFTTGATPKLPDDLIEPQVLWERLSGIDPYVMMTKLDFLPRYEAGVEINQFQFYVWQTQQIKVLPANAAIDIRMDYIRNLFNAFTDVAGNDQVNVINAASYLQFKTAALCARFIAENPTRADSLDMEAVKALDRVLGIGSKGRQTIITRRRPFRSGYKRRIG